MADFARDRAPLRVATWNVNSLKARLDHVTRWLEAARPDVLMLQELKCQEADVPREAIAAAGYHIEAVGQKSYNGVAILTRSPVEILCRALPGAPEDDQARYLEARVGDAVMCCLYLPNGNPVDTEKFAYKLGWMRRLVDRAKVLLAAETPFLMGGDFNICPLDVDVFDPEGFANDALCRPESRALFRELSWLGLTDALRLFHAGPHVYSFWDYQAGRWPRDQGLRIDHLMLSPALADRVVAAAVDKTPRGWERASDHTPVWCELA